MPCQLTWVKSPLDVSSSVVAIAIFEALKTAIDATGEYATVQYTLYASLTTALQVADNHG